MKNIEKTYGYKVKINQHCDHSEHTYEDANDHYGNWSSSYTNTIEPMIVKSNEYPDVASIHDLKSGERGFIVWVEWSSGDSFGHGTRTGVEALGLFKTYEDAEVLKKAIEDHARGYGRDRYEKDGAAYKVNTPDGQVFETGWAPWVGYFESLDSVNIDRVEVR